MKNKKKEYGMNGQAYLKEKARRALLDNLHKADEIASWAQNHPLVTEEEAKDLRKAEALFERIFERVRGDE